MRRLWTVSMGLMLLSASVWAGTIPSQITYQGTLKEKGVPSPGPTRNMLFRITDQDGTHVYWSSGNMTVSVSNGLFSAQLSPTNVDWQNVTPYIEVAIEGQQLSPREPVAATVYAVMSQSIIDGAITTAKLDSSVKSYLVPAGAIMLFESNCPNGWQTYAGLQGKFPVGADGTNFTAGTPGGNATHSHNVLLSEHTHPISNSTLQVAIGIRNIDYDNYLAMRVGGGVGSFSTFTSNQWFGYGNGMTHPAPIGSNPADVTVNGPLITGGTGPAEFAGSNTTDVQSNLPPYRGMIFCQKQ